VRSFPENPHSSSRSQIPRLLNRLATSTSLPLLDCHGKAFHVVKLVRSRDSANPHRTRREVARYAARTNRDSVWTPLKSPRWKKFFSAKDASRRLLATRHGTRSSTQFAVGDRTAREGEREREKRCFFERRAKVERDRRNFSWPCQDEESLAARYGVHKRARRPPSLGTDDHPRPRRRPRPPQLPTCCKRLPPRSGPCAARRNASKSRLRSRPSTVLPQFARSRRATSTDRRKVISPANARNVGSERVSFATPRPTGSRSRGSSSAMHRG